jgi:DNA-binding NtrC family response regulator
MAKILIFDEYPPIREILVEELTIRGNKVIPIVKSEQILKEITAFNPNLLILDLFMKGKYEWELLEEIKRENPDLPILIFSGWYPKGDPHLSQTQGFVMKSSVFEELEESINRILMQSDHVLKI